MDEIDFNLLNGYLMRKSHFDNNVYMEKSHCLKMSNNTKYHLLRMNEAAMTSAALHLSIRGSQGEKETELFESINTRNSLVPMLAMLFFRILL